MLINKNSLFKVMSLAGLMCLATSAGGTTLTPEDALGRAMSQMRRCVPSVEKDLNLIYTEYMPSAEEPAVYVFGMNDSYFLISADDRAEALLGYADNEFDIASIPPSLQWWLEEYARQIESASDRPAVSVLRTARSPIAPMVSTTWDQGEPYNDKCPVYNNQRSVTGCAATAMAQVMKYFNYPASGKGVKSYMSNGNRISLNFANITFDWQNMLDSYHNVNATVAEKSAVANLMYACGVSLEMQYSPYESGATDMVIPNALVNNFSYDKGVRYFMREYYSTAEWEDLVYNQLSTCGPVQYSGQSNEGGHSFVCDGYRSDGYFHFNWGWSGMSDGYYLLTALDPEQQGIGGSLSGFNFLQSVIGEVREPVAGSSVYPEFYVVEGFEIPSGTFRVGSTITVKAQVANFSYQTMSASLGLKFTNQNDGTTSYTAGTNVQLRQGYLVENYSVNMPMKSSGTYTVSPALRTTDGKWYDIPVKKAYAGSYTFNVNGGTVTATPNNPGSLRAEELNLKTKIYISQDFNLSATIRNPTTEDLYASVAPALVSGNNILAVGEYIFVNLNAGDSKEIDYIGTFEHTSSSWTPVGGEYQLCFLNTDTNEAISDLMDVTVYNKPTNVRLTITDFTIEGGLRNVDAANVHFTGNVQCRLGYFGGQLDVAIFPYSTSSEVVSIASLPAKPMFLSIGQFAALDASGRLLNAEIGKSYMAAVYNGMTQVSDVIVFTIGSDSSSIDSVAADEELDVPTVTSGHISFGRRIDTVEVYSISGTLMRHARNVEDMDISDVAPGIYIIKVGGLATHPERKIYRIVKH